VQLQGGRKGPRLLPWVLVALLVPAVVMLVQSPSQDAAPARSALFMQSSAAELDAAVGQPRQAVKATASALVQDISSENKANVMHNVNTQLAMHKLTEAPRP